MSNLLFLKYFHNPSLKKGITQNVLQVKHFTAPAFKKSTIRNRPRDFPGISVKKTRTAYSDLENAGQIKRVKVYHAMGLAGKALIV